MRGTIHAAKSFLLLFRFVLITAMFLPTLSHAQKNKRTQILRISQPVDVAVIDPAKSAVIEESNVIEQMYEGLVVYGPKDALPKPGAASEWKISKDLKTYTFRIRKNAKWSDGSDLYAKDFVYAWKRILTPQTGSPWAYMIFNVKNARDFYEGKLKDFNQVGIRALADKVLEVKLEKPQPYFLNWLCHSSMSPFKEESSGASKARDPMKTGLVVSNGAFIITGHQPKEKVVLKPNGFYWDAKSVSLDEVDFYPVENENTGLKMYETGLLDIHGAGIPSDKVTFLMGRKDFYRSNYLGVYFYRFNTKRKPFDDVLVRRALDMAVDKKIITDKIMRGGQNPAYNIVPQGISWYDPPQGVGYDPSEAREILRKAGYCVKGLKSKGCRKFPGFEILFNTQGNHRLIAEAMQAMFHENLGVSDIKLVNMDFRTVRARIKEGDYDISRGGWIGDFIDPATFIGLWTQGSGNNDTGWSDKKFEKLISQADMTIDLKKRADLFASSEKILNQELPFLPVYFFVRLYLKKDYVKDYYSNILDKHQLKYVYFSQ